MTDVAITQATQAAVLADMIAGLSERFPHQHDALTFVNVTADGRLEEACRSYQQLWENGQRFAAALDEADMERGDRFALLMQNHPEFVDAMVGASITDTVFVPIDPRTKGQKLSFMLSFAECRGIIIADYALANLAGVLAELPNLQWVWLLETGAPTAAHETLPNLRTVADIRAMPVSEMAVRSTDLNAPMQMLYTSGTTGDPKAIVASHGRFASNALLGPAMGLEPGDRPYTGLSLTHANAQLITLGMSLHMGLRTVISRKFTKSRLWDITRHYGCTSFNLLGGMVNAIYSEPECADDRDNPVRFVLSAGMPPNVWQHFQQRFDVEIFEFYGAAEGGMTLNPPGVGPVGSIGKPPPSLEGKIVDDNDEQCPPHRPGEIVFRSVQGEPVSVEYFKNPKASAEKTRKGWLRMGDIGYVDEEGWFYFLYRKGGGIRHNGDFINPAYVEKVLAEHRVVDDVFVYGVPAASGAPGEKDVVAAIVVRDMGSFDHRGLFEHCQQHLERNFVPSYLQVVLEIPKTASEKPQERFLLQAFIAGSDLIFSRP
ncbi:class I adenylate-forming enzyme family protein [Parahaliea mediterranea]|uniref:class I adenylate-forming enzyme family protein n=1 Tax=Parahaliea mediterranea TaxID=651086 RepID=UPI000E2EC444|nr:AMP-binding protein [Parahaliea mediterranea]